MKSTYTSAEAGVTDDPLEQCGSPIVVKDGEGRKTAVAKHNDIPSYGKRGGGHYGKRADLPRLGSGKRGLIVFVLYEVKHCLHV